MRSRGPRPGVRRALSVGLAVSALAAPAAATAQDRADPLPRLVVRRDAGAEACPDAGAIAVEVARHMGRPAIDPAGPAWMPAIEVAIAPEGGGYGATVAVAGRERRLADPGPGCAALGDALAVTIAILLDRDPPAPPPPPPLPPPLPPPPPPPRPDPRLAVAVEAAFTYGLLGASPRPAFAAFLELRVAGPFWIAPGALWAPPRSIDFPPGTVDVSLGAGAVRACAAAVGGAGQGPSLSACLEPAVGALRGTGRGFASDDSGTRLWASVGLGVVGRGPIVGPLGWTAHLSGFALVGPREQFDVRGVPGIAYDPAPVGLSAGAGLRVSIF